MDQIIRYDGAFLPVEVLPKTGRTVQVKSLLDKSTADHAVAVFVSFGEHIYLARPVELVPEGTELVRNGTGQICGIPVVAGGSS